MTTAERVSRSLLPHVGSTPLVELWPDPALPTGVRLFAKLESVNPGGSIKDRPVSRILRRALVEGHLAGGRRLLDSSSGNAGIAYAMLGATLGVDVQEIAQTLRVAIGGDDRVSRLTVRHGQRTQFLCE